MLTSVHPSPLSASNGFRQPPVLGANAWLERHGMTPIDGGHLDSGAVSPRHPGRHPADDRRVADLRGAGRPVTAAGRKLWPGHRHCHQVLVLRAVRSGLRRDKAGGIRRVAKSKRPVFQTLRGLLLITQICTAVYGFTMVGLVGYQVIFASYPLMVAALSVPFLGNASAGGAGWPSAPGSAGWRWRWTRAAARLVRR